VAITPTVITTRHIVATAGVHQTMRDNHDINKLVLASLARHLAGDWGTLDPHDTQANNDAAATRDRILSSYPLPEPRQVTTTYGPQQATALWIHHRPGMGHHHRSLASRVLTWHHNATPAAGADKN